MQSIWIFIRQVIYTAQFIAVELCLLPDDDDDYQALLAKVKL